MVDPVRAEHISPLSQCRAPHRPLGCWVPPSVVGDALYAEPRHRLSCHRRDSVRDDIDGAGQRDSRPQSHTKVPTGGNRRRCRRGHPRRGSVCALFHGRSTVAVHRRQGRADQEEAGRDQECPLSDRKTGIPGRLHPVRARDHRRMRGQGAVLRSRDRERPSGCREYPAGSLLQRDRQCVHVGSTGERSGPGGRDPGGSRDTSAHPPHIPAPLGLPGRDPAAERNETT